MMSALEENWKKLPQEIHRHVLSYTYSPQPKDLLYDIRNFHTSLYVIKEIYRCNKMIFAVLCAHDRFGLIVGSTPDPLLVRVIRRCVYPDCPFLPPKRCDDQTIF